MCHLLKSLNQVMDKHTNEELEAQLEERKAELKGLAEWLMDSVAPAYTADRLFSKDKKAEVDDMMEDFEKFMKIAGALKAFYGVVDLIGKKDLIVKARKQHDKIEAEKASARSN